MHLQLMKLATMILVNWKPIILEELGCSIITDTSIQWEIKKVDLTAAKLEEDIFFQAPHQHSI